MDRLLWVYRQEDYYLIWDTCYCIFSNYRCCASFEHLFGNMTTLSLYFGRSLCTQCLSADELLRCDLCAMFQGNTIPLYLMWWEKVWFFRTAASYFHCLDVILPLCRLYAFNKPGNPLWNDCLVTSKSIYSDEYVASQRRNWENAQRNPLLLHALHVACICDTSLFQSKLNAPEIQKIIYFMPIQLVR